MKLEYQSSILDDVERKYLSNLIKPFREKVKSIVKIEDDEGEFLRFNCTPMKNDFDLPYFEKGSMYKGMETCNDYTLEELGL